MSIRIEIIDPTIKDEKMLVATARFLMEIAGHQMVPAPVEVKEPPLSEVNKPITLEDLKVDGSIGYYEGNPPSYESIVKEHEKLVAETDLLLEERAKTKRKKKENIGDAPGKEGVPVAIWGKGKIVTEIPEHTHTGESPIPFAPPYAHCAVPIPPVAQMNFNTFMTKVTALRREEKIQEIDLLNIVRKHGIDKTHMLSTNPDLVPLVNADLDKLLEGK